MKPETEIDETGSFGEPEEKPAPFWKRSVWGISVATWGLCAVVLLAAIWYLFLRAPSETGMPPFNDADAGVQTWQTTQESSPSVQSTETMTVRTGEDMSQLARDVKTELDNRDEKIQATLNMLHDSINKLGEAIKKDEEYAQETRRQLDDIRSRLNGIMTQKSVTESSSTPHPAKKKTSSVLNGMKIMSMETGMAWIRWQGSTWAVREGQTLGNVVIQRIDPTNWQPHLPEDAQPAGYRWTDDESVLHAPSLHLQLFNTQVTTQGNLVQAGGLWHGMVSITLPPQNLQTFNELVRAVPRAVPWRIRMDLMPGGMKALNLKKTLLTYSSFISAVRPMYESVMTLAATDEKEPVCIMTIMASTWGKTREICTRNQAILKSAIEGWGVCGTTTTFGDPRRAWVNTILAASGGSGPVPLYPPLSHAISLFPLNRAGSVWRGKGNLMLHTEDGSAFEVGLASSQQNKHTELAPGDPGLGKSVLINTLSEIQISSAQKNLPFIAYIDKGYSAQGLVQLIRDSLPPERKDEAVGIILSNDPEYTRNLFDVMYGAKKPITPEKNFMSSVLCALCVDTGTGQPCNPGDTRQIINQLIELAFKEYGENNPRLYRASTEELVDSALQDSGLYEKHDATWWARSTWFEVRDMLHNAGYIMAAQRAHYQAMPQLPEVSSMLGHTSLRDVFGTVQRDGSNELLLDYIRRALEQGHNDYPMISGYTRFMINPETRVIAVDLNNVAGDKTPAGRLKTGIMYLLAGQIAGGDFTLPQYRDEVLKQLPREYHEIALKRINQLDQEVKTKVYDELHNARGIDFIWENLDTQEREQRKFAIRTVLSTQYLRDYPESVLKSANTLWLLRYKPEDIPVLRDNFNVPEFMLKRFLKMPEGPAPDGSGVPVLGVFRVKSGTLARILKFTVGPLELWALNSSPKDSALRKTLTNKLGSVRARKILAENFPRGSATSLIEHRAGQHNSDNVIEELASELIRKQGYNL